MSSREANTAPEEMAKIRRTLLNLSEDELDEELRVQGLNPEMAACNARELAVALIRPGGATRSAFAAKHVEISSSVSNSSTGDLVDEIRGSARVDESIYEHLDSRDEEGICDPGYNRFGTKMQRSKPVTEHPDRALVTVPEGRGACPSSGDWVAQLIGLAMEKGKPVRQAGLVKSRDL